MPDSTANAIKLSNVETRVEALEKDRDEDRKKNSDAHSEFYTRIHTLESGSNKTDVRFEQFETTQKEIKADVKAILGRDGHKWRTITAEIVKYVTIALLAYVAYQLGIST